MTVPAAKKRYARSQAKWIARRGEIFKPIVRIMPIVPDFQKMVEAALAGYRESQRVIAESWARQEAERKRWVEETQDRFSGASQDLVIVDEIQGRTVKPKKPKKKRKKRNHKPCPVGPGCMECGSRHGPPL